MTQAVQGYAEGYYGQLLTWQSRHQLLDAMVSHAQNVYYYAPKEDALHRLRWREPYERAWRDDFSVFCDAARQRGIEVVAGIAPGLDFDFGHLSGGADLQSLSAKSRQLIEDGADRVSLLMDDIDEDFHRRCGGLQSEGHAHAQLANTLADMIGQALWVTPRVYANELAGASPDYLPDFLTTLHAQHAVLYCGSDIVARVAAPLDIQQVAPASAHTVLLWDNLYANDYCPQRLFVGPWTGRDAAPSVLLNPTGLPYTDCLLLEVMAGSRPAGADATAAWQAALLHNGVPDAFAAVARYYLHPVFNGEPHAELEAATDETFEAIEELLWRWKTPLSREWYRFLFGLKLDLLLERGSLSELRMRKTLSAPLARHLSVRRVRETGV